MHLGHDSLGVRIFNVFIDLRSVLPALSALLQKKDDEKQEENDYPNCNKDLYVDPMKEGIEIAVAIACSFTIQGAVDNRIFGLE
jgi:hypothetical protein